MNAMLTALRARLIDDAHLWWRFWSTRLQAAGLTLIAAADPLNQALAALPADMRAQLPFVREVGVFLVVAGMVARVLRQDKLHG